MCNRNYVEYPLWSTFTEDIDEYFNYVNMKLKDDDGCINAHFSNQKKEAYEQVWVGLSMILTKKFQIDRINPDELWVSITYKTSNNVPYKLYIQDSNLEKEELLYSEKMYHWNLEASEEWNSCTFYWKDLLPPEEARSVSFEIDKIIGVMLKPQFNDETTPSSIWVKDIRISGLSLSEKQNEVVYQGEHKVVNEKGEPLYCIIPFDWLYASPYTIEPCSWLKWRETIETCDTQSFKEYWNNGERALKVRQGIKDGSYAECDVCGCQEINGEQANLLTLEELKKQRPAVAAFISGESPDFSGYPLKVNISHDTSCNLSCRSCNVSTLPRLPRQKKQRYLDEISAFGDEVEILYLSGMGDPFGSHFYREWLINFEPEKFPKLKRIHLQTNAIKLNETLWNKIGPNISRYNLQLQISIDGASKEVYEMNRKGGNFDTLLENLAFIKTLRDQNVMDFMMLCYVIQKNNYHEIPRIIEIAEKFSFDKVLFTKITNWGSYTDEEYKAIAVAEEGHPEKDAFIEIVDSVDVDAHETKIEFAI